MSIYKRGGIYWYKFMWKGDLMRESTKQGNDRKARNIESGTGRRLQTVWWAFERRKLRPPWLPT